jgi:hypothetical protein
MTGIRADLVDSMARDVRWAMDALRADEPWQAERILARAWETYVMMREDETERLAERQRSV